MDRASIRIEDESTQSEVGFFPPRFWGLDPLFSAKIKLNIKDVLSLTNYPEYPGVYCIGNHPVLGVHVMGDVVSVKEKSALIIYEVDDGSGVLNCTQWRRSEDSSNGLYVPSIGELVSVFGRVEEYRGEKQLRVTAIGVCQNAANRVYCGQCHICEPLIVLKDCEYFCGPCAVPEEDPNAEPCHWLEVEQAKRTVYCQRFTLPDGVVEPEQQRERKPVKEVVKDALIDFLKSANAPFTLSSLSSSDEVFGAVWESVKAEERDEGMSSSEKELVIKELNTLVKSLPRLGLVVAIDSHSNKVQYELLSEEKHLFPVILEYIKHKLLNPKTSQLGVPRDWIVEHVRGRERLQYVPAALVTAAISHLEDSSTIFSVSDGAYKTVT